MSERFGKCVRCDGKGMIQDTIARNLIDCPRCEGEGFDGGGVAYLEEDQREENEREAQEWSDQ